MHAGIALAIAAIFGAAVTGQHGKLLGALLVFVVLGAVDELVYHREISAKEHSVHAKEHLLFLAFVTAIAVVDSLTQGG